MAPKFKFSVCPVCAEPVVVHREANAEFNEYWDFRCDASIVLLPSGTLTVNEQCGNSRPLEAIVRQLNAEYAAHLSD